MFGSSARNELQQCQAELAASQLTLATIKQSMAMIEFTPQGEILEANEPFLRTMGYRPEELKGKHHRI